MYVILWEYLVKAEHITDFEEIYSAAGAWAQLFRKHPGYRGTELLRDANYPRRYVTIDRWVSTEAYNSFQREWQEEYKELDTRCERLMERETFLGTFLSVHSGG
ncbi:MAG TPA: antibiotic biosynthesis monooxygenase family protein [Anaerolineales bacterium]|nr:antibiotic biosynthesis monooxygenase family protein [Anaerolineales bacterium]